ncbi:hypothetical protein [Pigmentiphaga humi]|uniref:hypothetical protein n=1 Tax=Pigmentiphaga humi TaxID=2478468 RepID=UPI001357CB25|nr:hypothetical protein [Pigmentiphaga humi]
MPEINPVPTVQSQDLSKNLLYAPPALHLLGSVGDQTEFDIVQPGTDFFTALSS